ncbi:MAG TPA: hypothetical protein VMN39_00890, partial [Longimicrobiaceae bacterium]|nr:hypothetical protein [Longimicrobiaceae bacterium]
PHLHYEVRRRGRPVDPVDLAFASRPGAEIGGSERWGQERRLLTELLSRTPTVLHATVASSN